MWRGSVRGCSSYCPNCDPGLPGVGGAELLQALAATGHIDLCLVLVREGHPPPLPNELESLPARVITLTSPPQARSPTRTQRALQRSKLWTEHLGKGEIVSLSPGEPGDKVVYATDFRESPENVRKLSELARGAHTLFCEASFLYADRGQAERTQRLTTEACTRIANLAAGPLSFLPPL